VEEDKRLAKRIISRVKVLFGQQTPAALGFALNLSAAGLYLSSTRIFPPRTELRIRLEPYDTPAIELRGTVRWGQRVPQALLMVVKPGMGIRFESPPREYIDYFAHLVTVNPTRANPRLEAHFKVQFHHREQLIKEYTENISRGGLFIATTEIFEPGDLVAVDLVIPDLAIVWQVAGRVAYRLDAEKARQLESPPGIGIEIKSMDPSVKEAFDNYIQRLMRHYDREL